MSDSSHKGFDPNTSNLVTPPLSFFEDGDDLITFLREGRTPLVTEFIEQNATKFQKFFDNSLGESLDLNLLIDGLDSDIPKIVQQCRDVINLAIAENINLSDSYLDKIFFQNKLPTEELDQRVKYPETPVNVSTSHKLEVPTRRNPTRSFSTNRFFKTGGASLMAAATLAAFLSSKDLQEPISPTGALSNLEGISVSFDSNVEDKPTDITIAQSKTINNQEQEQNQLTLSFEQATQTYSDVQMVFRNHFTSTYFHPFMVKAVADDPLKMKYLEMIIDVALEKGLDPVLFANQMFRESAGFHPDVVSGKRFSHAGAVGLSQIMPYTARERGYQPEDLHDPATSVRVGAEIMAENMQKYNNDQGLAMVAYNGGAGAISFAQEQIGKTDIKIADWISFNQSRRLDRGVNNPSAWHVETYNYIRVIYGNAWEQPHKIWASNQQREGVPDHMIHLAMRTAEHVGIVESPSELIAALETHPTPSPEPT